MATDASVKHALLSRIDEPDDCGTNPLAWRGAGFVDLIGTVHVRNIGKGSASASACTRFQGSVAGLTF